MSERYPLNEAKMQEYIRNRGRNTPNKTAEATAAGIGYGRYMNFLNNPKVMLNTSDLQKLMRLYGLELVVVPVAQPVAAE
jgi:hypothetical protein